MPVMMINMLSGRTAEQKRALIRELTDAAVRTIDVEAHQVRVIINEISPDHWGAGGVSKAETESRS